MCSISVLTQWGQQQVTPQQWTPDTFGQFQKVLKLLEKLDAKLGIPDCEDPAKAAWMREVEARLAKLETTDA